MVSASERKELITFQRKATTENGFGDKIGTWGDLFSRRAAVRFGFAQEQREAAQETGVQAASFECQRSAELDGVTLKDRIFYDGSPWNLTERAPLDRRTIRFTGTRAI